MNEAGKRAAILAVDDDLQALRAIVDILKVDESFEVSKAVSAEEGVRIALEVKPDMIICGFRKLPECIDFLILLRKYEWAACPTFLIIYERSDFPDFAKGHENGADDYIERSLCVKVLLPKVRTLLGMRWLREELKAEKKELQKANEQLERNFKELTAILLKMLEVRIPGAGDRALFAKAAAESMAQKLDLDKEQQKNIVFAALLHEIGKIGLPDNVVDKTLNMVSPDSRCIFQQYATVGSMIVSTITGFKDSAEAVHHQLENYDGSGVPDGLMGNGIPVGAKILRAIVFAEDLRGEGRPTEEVIERIRVSIHNALDPRVANPLMEFLLDRGRTKEAGKVKIAIDALEPGMVVADDVYAASGIKLLPKGVRLQEKMLAFLEERNKTDPIIGGVYVKSGG